MASGSSSSSPEKAGPGRGRAEAKLQRQRARQAQQQEAAAVGQQQGASLGNAVAKVQHGSKILESIDQLRRRKARPSTDRICNFMLRKFAVDVADTIASLHKLLECEAVIEVDYKGGSSYRNAFNWAKIKSYKNRPEGFTKLKFSQATLNDAFGALVLTEPDYIDQGVPPHRLIEQLLEGNISNPTTRGLVEKHLDQEVLSGNLVKLSSGNYSLSDSSKEGGETDSKSKHSSSDSSTNGSPVKMYDLDDNTMDQDSRSNSLKSSRHASPKTEMDKIKNGNYLDSIVGKDLMTENDRYKQSNGDGYRKEDTARQNGRMSNKEKEEAKNVAVHQSYHKKSKAERKQRLCVRSDDSMDLMFNDKEINYKDENDENDRMSDDGECDQDAGRSSANVSPTPSQTNAGSFRSARRKRARKVFDPSDNLIVKKKRGRYSNAVRAAMASAQQQELQEAAKVTIVKENTKGSHRQCNECSKETDEALMACRDCTVRVHPSCVYTPEEKALKARTSWQCDNCKSCATCYETKFNGPMVTCYNCNDSYHYGCHTPRVTSSKNKWFCCNCNPKREKPLKSSNSNLIKNKIEQQLNKNSNSVPVIVKTRESPVKSVPEIVDDDVQNVSINDHGPPVDLTIPDVTDWDEDQVYRYFVRLFPKDAEVFRSQQIDGIALKLLTKNEIYNRFTSIVFGTRVKIWMQIVYLQKRRMWTGDIWM